MLTKNYTTIKKSLQPIYSNRLRVRACGICTVGNTILLVNHIGITKHNFWAPPGGGIKFGESAHDCLVREFKEETNLIIEVGEFLFTYEFIRKPLHAIELYFKVNVIGGVLRKGSDPETGANQSIKQVAFVPRTQLNEWKKDEIHGIFQILKEKHEISELRGYFKS